MKKILTLVMAVALAFVLTNETEAATPETPDKPQVVKRSGVLTVTDSVYNFGRIESGKPVSTMFTFTNTGKKPIAIENVATSCGCTTPEWSKKPVMPGKSTIIKVGYNAASAGSFNKAITVTYTGGGVHTLFIKGEVIQ